MNKCEEVWFEHAWKDNDKERLSTSPNPEKKDTCNNCGLIRLYKHESKSWFEYSDWKERPNYPWNHEIIVDTIKPWKINT